MSNSTIISSIGNEFMEGLNYQNITAITQTTPFIIALGLIWIFPLVCYLIWGIFSRAKSPDGRKLQSRIIQHINFWISFIIIASTSLVGILFIIFPYWAVVFE